MIMSLINLLVIASPRTKLIIVKILKSLIEIGIPVEVFRAGGNFAMEDKESFVYKLFNSTDVDERVDKHFKEYPFLGFLYRYTLHIRSSMWDKKEIRSQGDYTLSREIANLFMMIQVNKRGEET